MPTPLENEILAWEDMYAEELDEAAPPFEFHDRPRSEYLKALKDAILTGVPIPTRKLPPGWRS